jgi:hypothetical protein
LTGKGGIGNSSNHGVYLVSSSTVSSAETANITIDGIAGSGTSDGVRIETSGTKVESNTGNITLNGTATGSNFGINLLTGTSIGSSATEANQRFIYQNLWV